MTASRLTTRPTPRLMLSSGFTGNDVGNAWMAVIFRSVSRCAKWPPCGRPAERAANITRRGVDYWYALTIHDAAGRRCRPSRAHADSALVGCCLLITRRGILVDLGLRDHGLDEIGVRHGTRDEHARDMHDSQCCQGIGGSRMQGLE